MSAVVNILRRRRRRGSAVDWRFKRTRFARTGILRSSSLYNSSGPFIRVITKDETGNLNNLSLSRSLSLSPKTDEALNSAA